MRQVITVLLAAFVVLAVVIYLGNTPASVAQGFYADAMGKPAPLAPRYAGQDLRAALHSVQRYEQVCEEQTLGRRDRHRGWSRPPYYPLLQRPERFRSGVIIRTKTSATVTLWTDEPQGARESVLKLRSKGGKWEIVDIVFGRADSLTSRLQARSRVACRDQTKRYNNLASWHLAFAEAERSAGNLSARTPDGTP